MTEIIAPEPILQFILSSSQIYYDKKIINFDVEQLGELVKTIPDEWWHEKDPIVYFTYYDDGSYFCEREKQIYDYITKDYVKRVYEFNILSNEEAKQIYLKFANFFETVRINQLKEQKEILRKKIETDFDYILFDFINTRNKLLSDSDWSQLPDVISIMNQNEHDMWIKYRQYLRDFTESEDWKNRNYSKLVYPKRPNDVLKQYSNLTNDLYLTQKEHFQYFYTYYAMERINSLVTYLTLPSLNDKINEATKDMEKMSYDEYSYLIEPINQKLKEIDESLYIEIKIGTK